MADTDDPMTLLTEADKAAIAVRFHFKLLDESPRGQERREEILRNTARDVQAFIRDEVHKGLSEGDYWRVLILQRVVHELGPIPEPEKSVQTGRYTEWLAGWIDGKREQLRKEHHSDAWATYHKALHEYEERVALDRAKFEEQETDFEYLSDAAYATKYNTVNEPTEPVVGPPPAEPAPRNDYEPFSSLVEFLIRRVMGMTPYEVWAVKEQAAAVALDEVAVSLLDWAEGLDRGASRLADAVHKLVRTRADELRLEFLGQFRQEELALVSDTLSYSMS